MRPRHFLLLMLLTAAARADEEFPAADPDAVPLPDVQAMPAPDPLQKADEQLRRLIDNLPGADKAPKAERKQSAAEQWLRYNLLPLDPEPIERDTDTQTDGLRQEGIRRASRSERTP